MAVRSLILLLLLPVWTEMASAGSSCGQHQSFDGSCPEQRPANRGRMTYQEELVSRAHSLHLADTRQWQKILFYAPKWLSGPRSYVVADEFFFAEDGSKNPSAELDATLAAFFRPEENVEEDGYSQHPQCQFPARFYWLNKQLKFDPAKMKFAQCRMLNELMTDLAAHKVSFIFSSGYLNNPASMFGHTFLRVHKRPTKDGASQPMLDYSINFAAYPDNKSPLIYVSKGLAGMFPGYFDLLPFFIKVQEYNSAENRDLWEYELRLTAEQTELMLLGVFEVGRHRIDYYYLDDNCALLMLVLLEIADPTLMLSEQYKFWVTPKDTVRTVVQAPGLVTKLTFRPSNYYKYMSRHKTLDATEAEILERLVDKDETETPQTLLSARDPKSKARIIDTALDFIDFREKLVEDNAPVEFAKLRNPLLAMRAGTNVVSDAVQDVPYQKDPAIGHDSTRLGIANGAATESGAFTRLEWRPALHDVGAVAIGYADELEIRFMDVDVQYNWEDKSLFLSDFQLMEILSLAPWRPLLRPISWRLSFGMETECASTEDDVRCRRFYLNGGGGVSFKPFTDKHLAYMMLGVDLGAANHDGQGIHAGLGYFAGYIWSISDHWKFALRQSMIYRYGGRGLLDWKLRAELSHLLPGDFELRGTAFFYAPQQQYFLSIAKYL